MRHASFEWINITCNHDQQLISFTQDRFHPGQFLAVDDQNQLVEFKVRKHGCMKEIKMSGVLDVQVSDSNYFV